MVDGKIKVDSLQPLFAKSDKKFTRKQILSSASIAANRAANERGVKYSKTAGYFKKVHVKESTGIESKYAWLAYGFQLNFMYLPVCKSICR